MARRRFYKSRTQPDRGWVVGFNNINLTPASASLYGVAFDFADIDPEALTGRIEADKSDWFVKRVIFECFAAVSFTGTSATDVARIWQLGLGTAPNENANRFTDADFDVLSGETYNLWSRLFRTWSRPVYAGGLIPYSENNILAAEPFPVNSYGVTAPFWGPSAIYEDFEVSSAGLRNNQSVFWFASRSEAPASYDWDAGDILYLTINYRMLLQKRRA